MARASRRKEKETADEAPLSYSEAKARLEQIQEEIEGDELSLDALPALLQEAKGLITQCRQHIRGAAAELERFEVELKQTE